MWPVVPICDRQLLDVSPEDILNDGLFRKCDTYKGGGGYDKFNDIYFKRYGLKINPVQFVVQLKGCVLSCPYCYVTDQGINGKSVRLSTDELLNYYYKTNLDVFHLMGGSPALHLNNWKLLASKVKVFHSDFLLVEQRYQDSFLKELPGLHAVSFKERYLYSDKQLDLIWCNLEKLIYNKVDFYITFTGVDEFSHELVSKFGNSVLEDSFTIQIIDYEAIK